MRPISNHKGAICRWLVLVGLTRTSIITLLDSVPSTLSHEAHFTGYGGAKTLDSRADRGDVEMQQSEAAAMAVDQLAADIQRFGRDSADQHGRQWNAVAKITADGRQRRVAVATGPQSHCRSEAAALKRALVDQLGGKPAVRWAGPHRLDVIEVDGAAVEVVAYPYQLS